MIHLPSAGRVGRTPEWPIGEPTYTEREVWAEVWHTPQAVEWERLGFTRVVARYVRTLIKSEGDDATAAMRGEVRQLEDRLGLTPMAMLRLRWEILDPPEPEPETNGSPRRRVSAVDPKEGGAS